MKYYRVYKTSAFTLIEILIVVSVIGVLIALGSLNYANSLERGRDQRRRADIQNIRANLELYKSRQPDSFYPTTLAVLRTAGFEVSQDPREKVDYAYSPVNDTGTACTNTLNNFCTRYTLSATLELGGTYSVTERLSN